MDVSKEIRQALATGEVILGRDRSIEALKLGRAKLVILASNCPAETREDVRYYSKLSGAAVHDYERDGAELGLACGKPFMVSMIAVIEPGSSNILGMVGSRGDKAQR